MKILGYFEEFWLEKAGKSQGSINPDVIGNEFDIIFGSSISTDGLWVWRHDLRYYFYKYHVRLPDEFLVRVRELNYQPPVVPAEQIAEIEDELKFCGISI